MKTKIVSAFVLATLLSLGAARAQTPVTNAPAANQTVYSPRLPSAAELTTAAAAQNLTVEKIEQSDAQVTATYKTSTGQLNVVSYQLLPNASGAAAAPVTSAPTVVVPSPAPVVVQPAPSVVYYDSAPVYRYYPSYYPSYYYPPVSFRVGLNYGFRGGYGYGGYGHGGYHGGFHRGH